MGKKTISRAESEDFSIFDDGSKMGEVRIKPNAILWKARNKQSWKSVSIEKFAAFADENGKDVEK